MERAEHGWDPIWRASASWEFHTKSGYFIAPTLAYDWNEEDGVIVYGVNFGFAF